MRRDGPASSFASGPLALAWAGSAAPPAGDGHTIAIVEGRPDARALATELGVDPATPADQLIAMGWQRLGERMPAILDGQFALVAWDGRRALIARDRLSARPLFVTAGGGTLAFASEVRNLLALLPARPAPDERAMTWWLARTPSGTRTLYTGIERLPGGRAIVAGPGGWSGRSFRRPSYRGLLDIDAAGGAVEVRAGVDHSVGRALAGAHAPAVMLSGGLDSAVVAAAAHDRLGRDAPTGYSVVFPGHAEVDESPRIAAVRERLGLAGVQASFEGGGALGPALEVQREWDLPSATPNLFIWLPLLRRAASDGVDVLVDGEGGDELFGCACYLVADRLRRGRPLAAADAVRRLPGMGARPPARWVRRGLVAYGLRGALPLWLHRRLRGLRAGRRTHPWLSEAGVRLLHEADDGWDWKRLRGPRWWAQLATQLSGEALGAAEQFRRESRLTGVELRHPLRDAQLIDLMLTMPPELSFDADLDRPLLRQAFAGELPDEVTGYTEKATFNSLLEAAFRGPDAAAVRELLGDLQPELARLVRPDTVASLAAQTRATSHPLTWALDVWRLASLELWLRAQAGVSPPSVLEPGVARVSFSAVRR